MIGWISLHRKIQEHWLFPANRPFTEFEAWIDILMEVNHDEKKCNIGNQLYYIKVGESLKSLDTWSKRWSWNKSKTRRFFTLLQKDKMIEIKNEIKTTRLTVCNYGSYQSNGNASETQVKRKRNANETQMTPNNNINNYNNDNNENKISCFSFSDFWKVYPTKKGKAESEKKYNKLDEKDRLIIKQTINDFVNNKPFKEYNHPNPLTYINQKRWLDEVEPTKKEIPPFEFDFKKYGGDMNLFYQMKTEHERQYS